MKGKKKPKESTKAQPRRRTVRPTCTETRVRRREVEAMLALQVPYLRIQDEIAQKHGIAERTVRRDIKVVQERWAEEAKANRPSYRHQMRETLRKIMQKAMGGGDWKAAIAAADRLMKLDGLDSPVQVVHSGSVETKIERMTSDDKRKRLAALLDRYVTKPSKANGKANGANGANGNGKAMVN